MSLNTINELFFHVVDRNLDRVMLYKQTVKWIPISAREFYRDAVGVARALTSWGIGKGDRVAILSENRPEWPTAEFGTVLLGGIVVPIYPTLTPEQTGQMLVDSGARIVFVSTVDQLKKIQQIKAETKLEKIVVFDYIGTPDAVPMHRLMHGGPAARDPEFDARARAIAPDDPASIMYTSGTTGTPKGAILTQGNLASNLLHSLSGYPFAPGDVSLSFLPLSHITARHVDYAMFYHGVTIAYCPYIDQLHASVREVRPTLFVAVPRVYEKIRSAAEVQVRAGVKRTLYKWALRVGRSHRDEILAGKTPSSFDFRLADRLVYSKVRAALGGRVKIFISGGAPLGRDLAEWFVHVGIRIHEGYGLTETSPVIALNNPRDHRIGTVGKPLQNVEVRIAEDGEILVRGPSIFKGYWNKPQQTAEVFTEDGFFRTGDIGNLDADGFLSVTDRKKDLIKTSGGKFIAPQPIERKLKANPFVGEAVVIGDRLKFPAVVISPNFAELENWAREREIKFQSREELVHDARVADLFDTIVANANRDLAQFEKMKKVLLVAEEFTAADGSLTPTMKLRRRVVEERYSARIQQLYSDAKSVEAAVS
ncbi:MAG: AMP-dependent synthetase/ligase [Terriglobales bacterium]